ncbi:helix-turn-helix domain-containing protein [Streptococcus suis]|uniref:helix-turn-helix domain-containing protein n=1 Tax=Streptococcus suis TaxID=1307 RepID=UPI000CF4736E|nr:helix-turn-helix transcriptional regulator [Streptococcus suis]
MIKRHSFNKYAPKPEPEHAEHTLKDLRIKLGMTQKELAAAIEYPLSTYVYWEIKNTAPAEIMGKVQKLYEDTKDRIVDDGIDIIEKVSYIRHRLEISYDRLAQLLGSKHGTTVKSWMDGAKPQMKYMAEINRMYYELKGQHKPKPQKRRPTFCQINPLDKTSWKAEIESPVIVWR